MFDVDSKIFTAYIMQPLQTRTLKIKIARGALPQCPLEENRKIRPRAIVRTDVYYYHIKFQLNRIRNVGCESKNVDVYGRTCEKMKKSSMRSRRENEIHANRTGLLYRIVLVGESETRFYIIDYFVQRLIHVLLLDQNL